ncbi:Transcriptional regulatory protein QseB [Crenothrix polyspora]|uniref:Transcriptional regulatory protein QseB n=1 Tax=Crenothrix polyspora TaxID=360316 RepID=A0A1R4GZ38_9GAMM|nr:response regulator transcription factor [Crenothrix polyspora]SJM89248.1 Transcriptional regulatory protein QseB [Crenothrix polyspora]
MRLLLVEDDLDLSRSLKTDLECAGYAVDTATDGEQGEFLGMTESYDVVILDLGLPKLSGVEVLKRWRAANNSMPVIVLTARDAWHEKVDGFKAGADDYLGKPFHVQELLARLQALLKRAYSQNQVTLTLEGVALNEEQQTVIINGGQPINLTAIEFRLLRYFMLHPGKILSKTHLSEHIYDYDSDPDSNVIEVYINRLRRIVGNELIHTRRGQGYVFGQKP